MLQSCLITGGARSGKSTYALKAGEGAARPFFIATGWAGDEEMAARIARHKAERGPQWTTIETRLDVASAISEAVAKGADFILVDCLTLWTSNVLFEDRAGLERRLDEMLKVIARTDIPLFFVTNEVGSGIVPGDPLSRDFRDVAGLVNRKVASVVGSVVMTVCGIPMKVK